ncbi:MAG: flagellar basal-body MS-ring/collar protein FliF [Bdellovibrionota bacterium]|nr:flagellar basal-body MS-ring/collar protein FliF [Pseudomonadota bacterium]MDY6091516.1 flagellar basal-body MS-ring/collar protein FliF [Bdellovibrionota bacterium]
MATSLDPSAILGNLFEGYLKLPLVQKILFPLLIVASVAGIVFVSKWASQPDYAVLFSDLKQVDSATIVEKLKEKQVKYQIRGDGDIIAVSPPEMVHELRLSLAAEGLPKGGTVGFEIFDNTNFGTTSFVEKLKFVRAIQGELERTISSLDSVSSAKVHITQPEKTVFMKNKIPTTASVMLKLNIGNGLSKEQIRGIVNLVSGSVEGLTPENVTIVDSTGKLLTSQDDIKDEFDIDSERLNYQQSLEKAYSNRIEQMLMRVIGPEKVVAKVTADIDFSSSQREEESYDPSGKVIRSEKSIEEGVGTSQRGGVPGVVSNLTRDTNLLAPQGIGEENSNRAEKVKNYEISKSISKSISPKGKLIRLSVAVLVDGTYKVIAPATDTTPEQKEFVPLGEDTMQRIESLVKSAVGYDPNRGDVVTVENIPFYETDDNFVKIMEKQESQDLIFKAITKAVPIIFILLFFFVLVKPLIKFLITPTDAEIDLSRLLPSGLEELEQELEQEKAKVKIPTFEPAVDLDQLEDLLAENSRLVKENPQQAALLIRYWLNDGRL